MRKMRILAKFGRGYFHLVRGVWLDIVLILVNRDRAVIFGRGYLNSRPGLVVLVCSPIVGCEVNCVGLKQDLLLMLFRCHLALVVP